MVVPRRDVSFVAFLASTLLLLTWTAVSVAQEPVTLPVGWQQLPDDEFAAAVRVLYEQDKVDELSGAEHDAVRAEGKSRFLKIDIGNRALTYQTLEILHWLTRFDLPPDVSDRAKTALLARQDDWNDRPYAELKAKVRMMLRLEFNKGSMLNEMRRWVLAGGTKDQVPAADLQFPLVREGFEDLQIINGPFAVEWNGFLTPTKTGEHVFSVSPINVNSKNPGAPTRFSMTVSINRNVVLNSIPDTAIPATPGTPVADWISTSSPVTLEAGQPVEIKVTANADILADRTSMLHAVLFLQGPGERPAVVSPGNLTTSGPGNPGLVATYTWNSEGQPQSLTRTEPNIDAAWTSMPLLLANDVTLGRKGADEMWNYLKHESFLRTCMASRLKHPFLNEPNGTSAGLTSARRDTFNGILLQNPELFDTLTAKKAVEFYQAYRLGAPDSALDVFGAWAGRQADLTCNFTTDSEFDADNRRMLAHMAMLTTLQLPSHAMRLQNEYLQMADGRCSLPVAYILAASYHGRGRLHEWTAYLDDRLSNKSLGGDQRVNWLIARAEAEEIRYLPQELDIELGVHVHSRALDGRGYLDQALQAAQSPTVKTRVAQEIVARLVWGSQFQAAHDLLTQTASSLPSDQQEILTALQTQVSSLMASQQEATKDQAAAAREAYVSTLRKRRDQASARGDTAAVSRYSGLINAASKE